MTPLRYLSAAAIDECLPPVAARIDLAEQALVALARGDAEMPAKIGVHPREGALLHAMPAWLRSRDLVGLKWVAAFPDNRRHGLPAISGLVVLNDPATGLPTWITDAARITAVRTAAVSGVAIRLLAADGARRVAVLGAGVQARSHLEVLAELLPGSEALVHDRHPERAAGLATEASASAGRDWVRAATSTKEAIAGADVVLTMATLGAEAERIGPADVSPGALVVAVDFATYVKPELAESAAVFAVDDREQFLHYRESGYFDGYPEPATTMGELADGSPALDRQRANGQPALVTHLGVGLADVVFADAICRRAAEIGAGTELER
jgi:ornithine cyclodeaminase/alanine dehydrogenase-like protein (mu-crystallin family)